MSNLSRLLNKFKENFPEGLKPKVDFIEQFVVNYVKKHNLNIKFLNSCSTGFGGVRTRDQIIICSPSNMSSIGDFLYTIFHEIRHEKQIRDIKMVNPLTDFDLDDFEELFKQYWEMELDSDQFAKNMIARLVIKLDIPIEFAKKEFKFSNYIENYPSMSKMIENHLKSLINSIKEMKRMGVKYDDIQDHPIVKQHLNSLENFI